MRSINQKRIILVGKGASGKDFFKSYCQEKGLCIDIGYTTRDKRSEEIEGITYNYVDKLNFMSMVEHGKFYEFAFFNKNYYGTLLNSWINSDVFIMSPSGIKKIRYEDRKDCLIVFFDILERVRRSRLINRDDNNDSISRRAKSDTIDFDMFSDFNLRITNPEFNSDKLFKAIQKLRAI
jgi:guanylate kinase